MIKVCDYADLFLLARKKSAKTKKSTIRRRPKDSSNDTKPSRKRGPDRLSLEDGQPIIIHKGNMRLFVGSSIT